LAIGRKKWQEKENCQEFNITKSDISDDNHKNAIYGTLMHTNHGKVQYVIFPHLKIVPA